MGSLFTKYFDRGFEFQMRKPSELELKEFMDENKETFELLASEYVKKIYECKNMTNKDGDYFNED